MSNNSGRYIIVFLIFLVSSTNAQFVEEDGGYQEEGSFGPGTGLMSNPDPMSIISETANRDENGLIYEAKGRLVCGMTGINKVRVVLWDRFRGRANIIYDEKETDVLGNFQVRATKSSFDSQSIAPFLTIYHDCDDEATPGLRKMTVQLPSRYSNRGSIVLQTYDIGTWNLETSFAGEELELAGQESRNNHRGAGSRPIGGFGGENRERFGGNRSRWNHGGRRDRGDGGSDGSISV